MPVPGVSIRQIALAQALHLDASTALASLQNGQVFTSAAGPSFMNILPIQKTTKAITTKLMRVEMNAPHRIATSVFGSPPVASLRTIFRFAKSTPPVSYTHLTLPTKA